MVQYVGHGRGRGVGFNRFLIFSKDLGGGGVHRITGIMGEDRGCIQWRPDSPKGMQGKFRLIVHGSCKKRQGWFASNSTWIREKAGGRGGRFIFNCGGTCWHVYYPLFAVGSGTLLAQCWRSVGAVLPLR